VIRARTALIATRVGVSSFLLPSVFLQVASFYHPDASSSYFMKSTSDLDPVSSYRHDSRTKLMYLGAEQYCNSGHCGTYAGKFFRDTPAKGQKSFGGYANYWRGPSRFVIPIPDNLDPAEAAPMLCGGATVYSPLVQYGAGKTAKDVGIVGLGGLGHFAVIFAKAMGANVSVISHSEGKKGDAEKMGATTFISTGDDPKKAVEPYKRSLDLIISTTSTSISLFRGFLKGTKLICRRPKDAACRVPIPPPTRWSFRHRRRSRGRQYPPNLRIRLYHG
jgi:hypothetical protein